MIQLDTTDPTASNPHEQTARLSVVNEAERQAKKEGGPDVEDSSILRAAVGAGASIFIGVAAGLAADVVLGAMAGGAKGGTTNLGRSQQPPQTPKAVNLLGNKRTHFSKFLGQAVKPAANQIKDKFARAANWKKIKDEKAIAQNAVDNPHGDMSQAATIRLKRDLKNDTVSAKATQAKLKPSQRAALAGPR